MNQAQKLEQSLRAQLQQQHEAMEALRKQQKDMEKDHKEREALQCNEMEALKCQMQQQHKEMEALKLKLAEAGTRAQNEALEEVPGCRPQTVPSGKGASKKGARAKEPMGKQGKSPEQDPGHDREGKGGGTGGLGRAKRRKEPEGERPGGSGNREERQTHRSGHLREGTKHAKTTRSSSHAAGASAKGL